VHPYILTSDPYFAELSAKARSSAKKRLKAAKKNKSSSSNPQFKGGVLIGSVDETLLNHLDHFAAVILLPNEEVRVGRIDALYLTFRSYFMRNRYL
jgi:hypothetical protein